MLDNIDQFDSIVGGLRRGTTNAGQYGLEWDQDWNILAGIPGLQTHAIAVGRYGNLASSIFRDNLNPSQAIYGSGGNVAAHLVFFYAEETLARGRAAIAVGRFPSQNDFDSNPLNCNFQSNALCGDPKALGDSRVNVTYPDATWAARVRVRPIAPFYVQAGIFFTETGDVYRNVNDRSGFKFNSNTIDGQFFPVEVGYEPAIGPDRMPGHYKIGGGFDTANHNTWEQVGRPPLGRKGGSQAWVQFDQMLVRQGPGLTDGIIVTGDYVHNDPRYSTRANQYILAAIDRGFWKKRPLDTIGALISYTDISGNLQRTQALEQEFGLPLSGNFGNRPVQSGVQSHAINLELNYQIQIRPGVTFAPDFQYFIRPNAQKNLPNAALFGFTSHIELF